MEPLHTKKVGAFSRAGIDKSTTCVHFKNTQKDDSRTSNLSEVGRYCLAFAWFFFSFLPLSSQLQAKYSIRSKLFVTYVFSRYISFVMDLNIIQNKSNVYLEKSK
jgi:hypothetical protein